MERKGHVGLKSRKNPNKTQIQQRQKFLGKRSDVFLQRWEETGTYRPLHPGKPPCEGRDLPGFLLGNNNSALASSTSVLSGLMVEPLPYNTMELFSNVCSRTFLFLE